MIAFGNLQGQKLIKCEITNDTILLGNLLELTYSAENVQIEFEGPDFTKLRVFAGPNVSRTMSIINGKTTTLHNYKYQIKPEKIGVIIISPAYFRIGEDVYETPPFEIIVMPNPAGEPQKKYNKKVIYSYDLDSAPKEKKELKFNKKKKRI
jgi:hypothetical protein